MKNCSNCSKELNFGNKVIGGMGALNDGEVICRHCLKEISKIDTKFANNLKKYSLSEFKQVLSGEALEVKEEIKSNPVEAEAPQENVSEEKEPKKKMSTLDVVLNLIKLAVAIYLIYLGIKLFLDAS
jgi:hypothetical protein